MSHGLPSVMYHTDFSDPEYTQYFKNRVTSGYGSAIRGSHNHTDVNDFFFNPTNGFTMRHYAQYMQLPTFNELVETNFNQIIHIKFKSWGLNHWNRGDTRYYLWQRAPAGTGNWRLGLATRKREYTDYIRVETRGSRHRHTCSHQTTPD